MRFALFISVFLSLPLASAQEEPPAAETTGASPSYLSLSANINDFNRFADGGSDGNWYIGFNNAWIVKLPPVQSMVLSRAFIGAKVGRAKTRPNSKKPWLRELISGKIYMGISQTPTFSAEQSFFLSETGDIPAEADPQATVDGVGSAEWFWTEVPVAMVSQNAPNYLIIWSPTKYFVRASSAPILAAAAAEYSSGETRAWNNHSISGVPPRNEDFALETPLNNLSPALAIKIVPANTADVSVGAFSLQSLENKVVIQFSARGENINEAWVESSRDQLDWTRITRLRRQQPFSFTLPADKVQPGWFLRAAARDVYGNIGTGEIYAIPYAPQ